MAKDTSNLFGTEDEQPMQTGYSISFGPYLKGGSERLQRMLVLARQALPALPTAAQLAVLRQAEQGSARHLQALLSAKGGNPTRSTDC
jgi:hypothetical protein